MRKAIIFIVLFALVFQSGLGALQPVAAKENQPAEEASLKPQAASDNSVNTFEEQAVAGNALQSPSSAGAYSISGRVTDPNGDGIEGVTIRALKERVFLPFIMTRGSQASSQPSQPTSPAVDPAVVTDANGYYTVHNLEQGRFTVTAELEGVIFTTPSQVVVLPGAGAVDFQVEIIDPIIPDTTEVLTDATDQYMQSVSLDSSVITYTQSTPELQQLAPGDILVSDGSTAAPNGLLRKVTSVSNHGSGLVVTTEPAALEDAIEDGAAYNSAPLTENQVTNVVMMPGVQMNRPATTDAGFSLKVNDVVLYDDDGNYATKNDQVRANGSIEFDMAMEFYLKIQAFSLKQFTLANRNTLSDSIEIFTELEAPIIEKEKVLATYKFTKIKVMIGIVPVIIEPVMEVVVGVDGSVSIGISTGLEHEFSLRVGISYTEGIGWRPIHEVTNTFDFTPPHATLEAALRGYFGLRFNFFLYGVAGLYGQITPYLEIIIQPLEDPWWELYIGVDLPFGFRVASEYNKILKLDDYEIASFELYRMRLAHSESQDKAPDAPAIIGPADGALNQDFNVDLKWMGSDPDGDKLNYDVYFGATNPPPQVTRAQNAVTYDPGLLNASAEYYWKVVAWDEHGMSTASPVWKFLTFNNPPNIPTDPIPSSAAVDQSLNLTLHWKGGDPDAGDSLTYTVYLGTVNPPVTIVSSDQSATNFQTSSLAEKTLYYWQVVAKDPHGVTTPGPVWEFTTGDKVIPGQMVLIPAGNFQMGCDPQGAYECPPNEPLHTVYLDAYRIGRYEVTIAEYADCVKAGACPGYFWYNSPNHPVDFVSWSDANNYCTWAGGRLPTEAEWEKAARGPFDTRAYPWGNNAPDTSPCTLANFYSCGGQVKEVGSYPAGSSPYGVRDMAGNVSEWVNDWYQENYYSSYPADSWPPNPTGPSTGDGKVERGGYYYSMYESELRVASRSYGHISDSGSGFRCADDPTEP